MGEIVLLASVLIESITHQLLRVNGFIGWIEKIYNRLRVLPIGKDKRLEMLREALVEARARMEM